MAACVCGSLAALISETVCTPLDVVRTRVMCVDDEENISIQNTIGNKNSKNPFLMLRNILESEGLGSLFKGSLKFPSSFYDFRFIFKLLWRSESQTLFSNSFFLSFFGVFHSSNVFKYSFFSFLSFIPPKAYQLILIFCLSILLHNVISYLTLLLCSISSHQPLYAFFLSFLKTIFLLFHCFLITQFFVIFSKKNIVFSLSWFFLLLPLLFFNFCILSSFIFFLYSFFRILFFYE